MAHVSWPRVPVLVLALGGAAWLAASASTPAVAESAPRYRRPPPPQPPPDPDPDPEPPRRPPPAARFRMELTDDGGRGLPTFALRGRRYVLGRLGARYMIRLVNPTAGRVEAVVSVDGLDAVDGKPASFAKRGYVLPPFGDVSIEGFRTSMDDVATFRFSAVRDSYAARKGDDRNVGVIGAAFFRERLPEREVAESAPKRKESAAPRSAAQADRPGLGTEFGERRVSTVQNTRFERASSSPTSVVELRYDDRAGLARLGLPVDESESDRRESAEPFPDRRFATPP